MRDRQFRAYEFEYTDAEAAEILSHFNSDQVAQCAAMITNVLEGSDKVSPSSLKQACRPGIPIIEHAAKKWLAFSVEAPKLDLLREDRKDLIKAAQTILRLQDSGLLGGALPWHRNLKDPLMEACRFIAESQESMDLEIKELAVSGELKPSLQRQEFILEALIQRRTYDQGREISRSKNGGRDARYILACVNPVLVFARDHLAIKREPIKDEEVAGTRICRALDRLLPIDWSMVDEEEVGQSGSDFAGQVP